jgi:hypothetical protein
MKMKTILATLLLSVTLITNGIAQKISSEAYNHTEIHEDFSQEGNTFPIINTNENQFIIDNGDYFLNRNNKDGQYIITANNSTFSDFILKTSIRIGPSNNKNASIGIILKAQQKGEGAIIFEINKTGEYRIKQFSNNTYKTLNSNFNNEGWLKSKIINGVNEHNHIEIRTENNFFDIYINNNYLTSFFNQDYKNGSSGLIISPETKARIAYYHLNTQEESTTLIATNISEITSNTNTEIEELNIKIATLEAIITKLNFLSNEQKENQRLELKALKKKNSNQDAATIEREKEIVSLNMTIAYLKNSNLKAEGLEKKIAENINLINNLTQEKRALSTEFTNLTETATSLNTKYTELAARTIEQEKEIVSLTSAITNLKSKNTSASSTNKQQTKKIEALKQQVTLEKSVSTNLTNDLNKENKSSNSKIKKLTTEVNTLKNQLNTTTNINASLTSDLSTEKIAHGKTKNGLSKSLNNKSAEIKALEDQLNTINQQLKSANKKGALANEYAKNEVTLTAELKNTNQEISVLRNIKNKQDIIVKHLNIQLSLLKAKQLDLNSELQTLNKKISNLETTNTELKELFILKDFEANGVKPSDLINKTNAYSKPKYLEGKSTIYAVQFGVFMQLQSYSTLKVLDEAWYEKTKHGTYVYLSGKFKNPKEATTHKNKIAALGYPNAFVVTLRK